MIKFSIVIFVRENKIMHYASKYARSDNANISVISLKEIGRRLPDHSAQS